MSIVRRVDGEVLHTGSVRISAATVVAATVVIVRGLSGLYSRCRGQGGRQEAVAHLLIGRVRVSLCREEEFWGTGLEDMGIEETVFIAVEGT